MGADSKYWLYVVEVDPVYDDHGDVVQHGAEVPVKHDETEPI